MSQHPSLKTKGKVTKKRSVYKRFERIDALKAQGSWKDGESVFGLRKTKTSI
jgi:small basic protein (TIGR04137 family)